MDLELTPPQPEPVAHAIEALVEHRPPEPDPWWRAGLDEILTDKT
jgi:hypothetical protein